MAKSTSKGRKPALKQLRSYLKHRMDPDFYYVSERINRVPFSVPLASEDHFNLRFLAECIVLPMEDAARLLLSRSLKDMMKQLHISHVPVSEETEEVDEWLSQQEEWRSAYAQRQEIKALKEHQPTPPTDTSKP